MKAKWMMGRMDEEVSERMKMRESERMRMKMRKRGKSCVVIVTKASRGFCISRSVREERKNFWERKNGRERERSWSWLDTLDCEI